MCVFPLMWFFLPLEAVFYLLTLITQDKTWKNGEMSHSHEYTAHSVYFDPDTASWNTVRVTHSVIDHITKESWQCFPTWEKETNTFTALYFTSSVT